MVNYNELIEFQLKFMVFAIVDYNNQHLVLGNTMKKTIQLLSLILFLTGCTSTVNKQTQNIQPEQIADPLDKVSLIQLLPGSTVYENVNDNVQVGFYSADNTMKGNTWGSAKEFIDEGVWSINEAGQLCNAWQGEWANGSEQNCYSIYPSGDEKQYFMVLSNEQESLAGKADLFLITIAPDNSDEFE